MRRNGGKKNGADERAPTLQLMYFYVPFVFVEMALGILDFIFASSTNTTNEVGNAL